MTSPLFLTFCWVVSLATIPHLLLARKRPARALAWVVLLLTVPGISALYYWLFTANLGRKKQAQAASLAGLPQHPPAAGLPEQLGDRPDSESDLIGWLSEINQIPPATARTAHLLINAKQYYPALENEIHQSQHHVHLAVYRWRDDDCGHAFVDLLALAAKRGVQVRLLLDAWGSFGVKKELFQPLIDAGGQVAWFHLFPKWPLTAFLNLRNRRILQIIDGSRAFVGGMNMGREHMGLIPKIGSWEDAQLFVEGNIVTQIQEVFARDWFLTRGEKLNGTQYFPEAASKGAHLIQCLATGLDLGRDAMHKSLLAIFANARKRVWISTESFRPDAHLLSAIQMCTARGVDVRVIVSVATWPKYQIHLSRCYYQELLEWGVRIFEYAGSVNRKETMLFDEGWIGVGSGITGKRTKGSHLSLSLLAHVPTEVAKLEHLLSAEFSMSQEIQVSTYRARSLGRKLSEGALRLTASWV